MVMGEKGGGVVVKNVIVVENDVKVVVKPDVEVVEYRGGSGNMTH